MDLLVACDLVSVWEGVPMGLIVAPRICQHAFGVCQKAPEFSDDAVSAYDAFFDRCDGGPKFILACVLHYANCRPVFFRFSGDLGLHQEALVIMFVCGFKCLQACIRDRASRPQGFLVSGLSGFVQAAMFDRFGCGPS